MRGGGHQDTANGELESKTNADTDETWLFQYDVLGNLLSVGLPNGDLIEYLVDGLGRRVGKKKNGVLLKQWIYRDALKPAAELDGAGNLVAQFVYGSKSNVPDYVRRGGTTYRVISDHLGSPRYVVNVANANDVPFTASYTSFGEATGTGFGWMPFGFAGGVHDADTGLIRFGVRDYDSGVGRWTARDPQRFDGAQSNLYAYVSNEPVDRLDSPGTGPLGCAAAIAACGLTTIWDIYSFKSSFDSCMEKAKEAMRSKDERGCGAESISRDRKDLYDTGAQCLSDAFADNYLLEGVNGLACLGAMLLCFGQPI